MTQASAPTGYAPFPGSIAPNIASRAALSALTLPYPQNGLGYFCSEAGIQALYMLSLSSGAAIDGTNVLSTTAGGASRWLKLANGTIPATSNILVRDEGVALPGSYSTLNFVGQVAATDAGAGVANITVPQSGNLIGTFNLRPPANTVLAGTEYITTDGPVRFISNGVDWFPLMDGRVGVTPPAAGSWTVYANGGAATTLANSFGSPLLSCVNGGNGEDIRLARLNAALPGASWRLEVNFHMTMPIQTPMYAGIGTRESATGSIESLSWNGQAGGANAWARRRSTASNLTTAPNYAFSAETAPLVTWSHNTQQGAWACIDQNRKVPGFRLFETSVNGIDWATINQLTCVLNDFITPDEVYFQFQSSSAGGPFTLMNRIISWNLFN